MKTTKNKSCYIYIKTGNAHTGAEQLILANIKPYEQLYDRIRRQPTAVTVTSRLITIIYKKALKLYGNRAFLLFKCNLNFCIRIYIAKEYTIFISNKIVFLIQNGKSGIVVVDFVQYKLFNFSEICLIFAYTKL